jgi:hypothetical protein
LHVVVCQGPPPIRKEIAAPPRTTKRASRLSPLTLRPHFSIGTNDSQLNWMEQK